MMKSMLTIHRFVTGPIETNTWLVCNQQRKCFVVDPSSGCDELLGKIGDDRLSVESIILTHSHFDHILGIPELLAVMPQLPVYIHPVEINNLADEHRNGSVWFGRPFALSKPALPLSPGRQWIGSFEMEVIHVPGHTPGGCALVLDGYCFCGDALFAGSIGRSDLPGGNGPELLLAIKSGLCTLPDETVVCPGHGGRTTIGREKQSNPFLLRN